MNDSLSRNPVITWSTPTLFAVRTVGIHEVEALDAYELGVRMLAVHGSILPGQYAFLGTGLVEGHLLFLASLRRVVTPDPQSDVRFVGIVLGSHVRFFASDLLAADGAGRVIRAVVPPLVIQPDQVQVNSVPPSFSPA